MKDSICLNIIQVTQPIGELYIGKLDGITLYQMAKADMRRITENDDYIGIQRSLDLDRVKEIKKYVKTIDASFPNSIILNLDSKKILDSTENTLTIEKANDTFTIIDGQHRLAGFSEGDIPNFELMVTILIDLDYEQQSLLFSTINTEQRRVDPSNKYDLAEYSSVKTPRKIARELALAFTIDKDSPWFNKIKMTGKKDRLSQEGIITLKAFVEPILNYIYPESDYYEIRNELMIAKQDQETEENIKFSEALREREYDKNTYIFWELYKSEQEDIIYKILLNYFRAFRDTFKTDWGNKNSILTKSIGYNAMMKLFLDIYKIGFERENLSYNFFESYLQKLSPLKGKLSSKEFGTSGQQAVRYLYQEFSNLIK